MDEQLLIKFQDLIQQGEKLVPEGGLEFSGYNAKMQSKYLIWRKNCLDVLAKVGDKANPLREKLTKDENGAYFYQNSAQLILDTIKKSLPLVESEVVKKQPAQPAVQQRPMAPQAPVHKAEDSVQKPSTAAASTATAKSEEPKSAPAVKEQKGKEVLVLSSGETELQNQLTSFLKEITIEPIVFKRGQAMDAIITFLDQRPNIQYAFYLYNAGDANNAMFEAGYLMGKVGRNRIVFIHKKEDTPPKGIPGILYKEIIVKLEEISFGLIKDLKSAGYSVSI